MKASADKYVEAQYYFRRLRSIYPQSGLAQDALMSIAWAKMRMRKFDEAVFTFKEFLREYPTSESAVDAERYIAYTYEKAGVTQKALRLYRKFMADHPDSGDINWVKKRINSLENPSDRKKGN
jgi:outer membrane protein assembly factor BamD (BamD/ComL family)